MSAPPTKRLAAPGAPEPRAPKKYVAVAASGADSIDEVQTLSIRLPNGDLRSWQVPRGTPIESITEEFEKELPPYHEAKLFVRDEILCGTIADEVEGEVTLVRMPSITKALVALQRLHGSCAYCMFLTQPQYQELLQALHFIAQYEGLLEEAHAKTVFATVYDMYVDDWEADVSGEPGQAASGAHWRTAASGAHWRIWRYERMGIPRDQRVSGAVLSTRPEFYFHMEMVLRLVGRFCDLSTAAKMLIDLRIGHRRAWGNDEGSENVFREHCLEALEQIQKNHQGTEEFQTWARRYGFQYGVCAAPASGGLWIFAPQRMAIPRDQRPPHHSDDDDDGDDDDDDDGE